MSYINNHLQLLCREILRIFTLHVEYTHNLYVLVETNILKEKCWLYC